MPIYEYKCRKCGEVQEKILKIGEENKDPCKKCEAPPEELERILSVFAKHLSWSKWNVG
jgi:putative FmdB family regulatory protein